MGPTGRLVYVYRSRGPADRPPVDDLVIDPFVRRISRRSLKLSLIVGIWRTIGPSNRTNLLAIASDPECADAYFNVARLYEREGLLLPSRSVGNTRLYEDSDLERLEIERQGPCRVLRVRDTGKGMTTSSSSMEGSAWFSGTAQSAH